MANVVIYDEVTKRVKQYLKSVNTPDYSSRPDVLVNPDVSTLLSIALRYWKVVGTLVQEMTQPEKDIVDQEIANARELAIRIGAKAGLDGFGQGSLLLRAFADIIKDEINILRGQHGLPDRTLSQLKTAIKNKVDSGDVDND